MRDGPWVASLVGRPEHEAIVALCQHREVIGVATSTWQGWLAPAGVLVAV